MNNKKTVKSIKWCKLSNDVIKFIDMYKNDPPIESLTVKVEKQRKAYKDKFIKHLKETKYKIIDEKGNKVDLGDRLESISSDGTIYFFGYFDETGKIKTKFIIRVIALICWKEFEKEYIAYKEVSMTKVKDKTAKFIWGIIKSVLTVGVNVSISKNEPNFSEEEKNKLEALVWYIFTDRGIINISNNRVNFILEASTPEITILKSNYRYLYTPLGYNIIIIGFKYLEQSVMYGFQGITNRTFGTNFNMHISSSKKTRKNNFIRYLTQWKRVNILHELKNNGEFKIFSILTASQFGISIGIIGII